MRFVNESVMLSIPFLRKREQKVDKKEVRGSLVYQGFENALNTFACPVIKAIQAIEARSEAYKSDLGFLFAHFSQKVQSEDG